MNQPELVLEAMQDMYADDPVENECVTPDQVGRYVKMNFGKEIAACGTVMADMVAPGLTQTKTSKVPLHLRVLERVRQGLYRLLPEAAETSADLENLNSPTPSVMHPALNQILYGPPGTGKTYRVIREAAAIIAGQPIADDQAAKMAYDKASTEDRIRLATFHQSFSYEDFIEGIRPVMEEDGKAAFQVRDGIFKEIATEALFACLEEVPALPPNTSISETDLNDTMSKLPRRPGENTITGRVWQIADELSTNDTPATRLAVIDKALAEGINNHTAHTQYGHWRKAKGLTRFSRARQIENNLTDRDDDEFVSKTVQSYLELGPASGWQLRADKNFPTYVLIIDEINRGNISRIFGELITLIEDDKREGEANALRVTLPSSREPFTVPPNLYLLGTMNTADKSLALLDVALRRRFEFRELAPDFTACADLPEEMRGVLKRLNERIELRKDRDHRIGHAFFMGVKEAEGFNRAFVRKVVPLLQEYFFNDIDGARFVLGEIGRESEPGFLRQITAASADAKYQRNRWRWFTDVEPDMDCWSRLSETLGS
jgi:5-methylcytosine-specific restriction protein B